MQYVYLERKENFTEENLKKNKSKVLQLKWDSNVTKDGRQCLTEYNLAITQLFHSVIFKNSSYEEKKDWLKVRLAELRCKYPEEFLVRDLGWYDNKVRLLKVERDKVRKFPVDKKLVRLAEQEGRVSVVIRMVGVY